jgi:CHRD domain
MKHFVTLSTFVAAGLQLAACDMQRQPPVLGQSDAPTLPARRVVLRADLTGREEVPPIKSAGTGDAMAILNPATQELTWSVNYRDLSGPAVSAHIHGPSGPGQNAVAQIDIGKGALGSPLRGSAKVTPQEAQQILEGKWYVNVHTAHHLGGEIRGQLEPVPASTGLRKPGTYGG